MPTIRFDFMPDSFIESEPLNATIATRSEVPPRNGGFSRTAFAYGIALARGNHVVNELWGTGYANNPTSIAILAINHILKFVPEGVRFTVYALSDLLNYIKRPDGWARYALAKDGKTRTGKPMDCYPAVVPVLQAFDAGMWSFKPVHKTNKAVTPWYSIAEQIADKRLPSALQHKAEFQPTPQDYPKPTLIRSLP